MIISRVRISRTWSSFFLNLSKDTCNLLIEQGFKTLFSFLIKIVFLTELLCEFFSSISFIYYDSFRILTFDATKINVYEE